MTEPDVAVSDERARLISRVAELRAQGKCPTCHDLESGEPYGRGDRLIYEDDRFVVLFERFPRMPGHTIVVYKPHREDVSELTEAEGADVMTMCLRVISALKASLGAEKVPQYHVRWATEPPPRSTLSALRGRRDRFAPVRVATRAGRRRRCYGRARPVCALVRGYTARSCR